MRVSNQLKRILLPALCGLSMLADATTDFGQGRVGGGGQRRTARTTSAAAARPREVLERDVRAHEEFLASDAMQGRGSGTGYELLAGQYVASQLRQFGVEPAGDADAAGRKTYIQTDDLTRESFASAPALTFSAGGTTERWTHGQEFLLMRASAPRVSGALQKMSGEGDAKPGAVVLLNAEGLEGRALFAKAQRLVARSAAVLIAETPALRQRWAPTAARPLQLSSADGAGTLAVLSTDAFKTLQQAGEGTQVTIEGTPGAARQSFTWNAVGVLRGSDPTLANEAVLLTAHMDHLGVGEAKEGDAIYNGADDDASGVVAVLELARVLGAGARPKRTVYFVTFGSEETGGAGAKYFLDHPPVALDRIVANLEFEMIGRPDPKVEAGALWLTGYERSNLGPELARQGARLVADPHPEQNFFQRSDNFALARRGVVAHTVSSFGLHPQYHHPDDDLAHLDIAHMTHAINSMVRPVVWLVNTNFTPAWVEGRKP